MASLAPDHRSAQIERTVHAVLVVTACVVTTGTLVLIVTMERGSVSQGGRFFVALGALVFLGTLENQVAAFARRYWPLELGTSEPERRCARTCLLLLASAAVILLGAAFLLPSP